MNNPDTQGQHWAQDTERRQTKHENSTQNDETMSDTNQNQTRATQSVAYPLA